MYHLYERYHSKLLHQDDSAISQQNRYNLTMSWCLLMSLRSIESEELTIFQQLSQDERLAEAALPSLAIVAVGIIPVIMISQLMKRRPSSD